jgi:hypothetical protein
MFASCRAIKFGMAALAMAAMLAGTPTVSCAATGSVRITITRAQFIVGGGSGTLRFQGERYPQRVGGVGIAEHPIYNAICSGISCIDVARAVHPRYGA